MDESIRALERRVAADPTAASWSELAIARARAGRRIDAHVAAVRACELDPGAAARELILRWAPVESAEAAPWPGLRKLGRVRAIETGERFDVKDAFTDLGGGVLCWVRASEVCAVDVFTGRTVWKRPREGAIPVGFVARFELSNPMNDAWETATPPPPMFVKANGRELELLRWDPRTGADMGAPIPIGPPPPSDKELLVAGWPTPSGVVLAMNGAKLGLSVDVPTAVRIVDLERHRLVRDIELRGVPLALHGDALVVLGPHRLRAVDLEEQERWNAAPWLLRGTFRPFLVTKLPDASLALVDPSKGAVVRSTTQATEGAGARDGGYFGHAATFAAGTLVVLAPSPQRPGSMLVALDAETLQPRWTAPATPFSPYPHLISTADAALMVTWRDRASWRLAATIRSHDPSTGAELGSIDLSQVLALGRPLLAAGRLVFPGATSKKSTSPAFYAIEE